ncbi:MAG: hypothetical protein PHW34_10310 [Hespellia sp.]|nr:hypothetical protein [Hespellia sp.]
MKRRADLLVNGVYKRITIWDALDMKKNHPDFWEEHKEKIFSICKKPENKARMVFQTGKNGVLKNSYFRYYKEADLERRGEGSEESYRHELFKECISRIKCLELRWKGEALRIYPDEILQEETIIMEDGSKRIVDLLVRFNKANPSIYVEKWEGKLAIEIKDTHAVDDKKISQMKQKGLACLEFTVNKWGVKENFNSKEEEENQVVDITNRLEGGNKGYIFGELLVDPISKKYFSTKLYEDEKKEKERVAAELYHLKDLYEQLLDDNKSLKNREKQLEKEIEVQKSTVSRLETKAQAIELENSRIKSSFWYKIFGKNKAQ